MTKTLKEKMLKAALVLVSIFTLSWTSNQLNSHELASEMGGSGSGSGSGIRIVPSRPAEAQLVLTSKPIRDNRGPKPDAAARTQTRKSSDRETPDVVSTWKEYWESELQKTKDPIFQSAIRFQIQSLNQAIEPLNSALKFPKAIDPNLYALPSVTAATADTAFMENYKQLLSLLEKNK